ncbi:hypothetical protein MBLNU230_g2278t1 [Neophaeotheca triangularis]
MAPDSGAPEHMRLTPPPEQISFDMKSDEGTGLKPLASNSPNLYQLIKVDSTSPKTTEDTSKKPPILQLPAELLLDICDLLITDPDDNQYTADVKSISLVSRYFNEIASSVLYRNFESRTFTDVRWSNHYETQSVEKAALNTRWYLLALATNPSLADLVCGTFYFIPFDTAHCEPPSPHLMQQLGKLLATVFPTELRSKLTDSLHRGCKTAELILILWITTSITTLKMNFYDWEAPYSLQNSACACCLDISWVVATIFTSIHQPDGAVVCRYPRLRNVDLWGWKKRWSSDDSNLDADDTLFRSGTEYSTVLPFLTLPALSSFRLAGFSSGGIDRMGTDNAHASVPRGTPSLEIIEIEDEISAPDFLDLLESSRKLQVISYRPRPFQRTIIDLGITGSLGLHGQSLDRALASHQQTLHTLILLKFDYGNTPFGAGDPRLTNLSLFKALKRLSIDASLLGWSKDRVYCRKNRQRLPTNLEKLFVHVSTGIEESVQSILDTVTSYSLPKVFELTLSFAFPSTLPRTCVGFSKVLFEKREDTVPIKLGIRVMEDVLSMVLQFKGPSLMSLVEDALEDIESCGLDDVVNRTSKDAIEPYNTELLWAGQKEQDEASEGSLQQGCKQGQGMTTSVSDPTSRVGGIFEGPTTDEASIPASFACASSAGAFHDGEEIEKCTKTLGKQDGEGDERLIEGTVLRSVWSIVRSYDFAADEEIIDVENDLSEEVANWDEVIR